ncbi:MAG: aromatic acid exporter family protein [Dehalobacterium sp.]
MTLGARTIKTGLAVAISIYICNFFNLHPSIFAGAAAVLAIQPSLGLSLANAKQQILVHFTAVTVGIFLGYSFGSHPLAVAISTITLILICQHFKWQNSISSGVVASIFVLASPGDEFLYQAFIRSLSIFIGMGTGLIVNATIAPPHFNKLVQEKLLELNQSVSQSFFQAVQSYLSLAIPAPEDLEIRKNTVGTLFKESRRIYNLHLTSDKHSWGGKNDHEEDSLKNQESSLFSEYLTYNTSLWQKTLDIFLLAEQRRERRRESGDMPVSPEFHEIMEILKITLGQFSKYNYLLQEKISGKACSGQKNLSMWSKLDLIINEWHDHYPSSPYHLHALIGVSLVADKIRWAETEAVRLLNMDYAKEDKIQPDNEDLSG